MWEINYWAPSSRPGNYYTEIVPYCSRENSRCWNLTNGGRENGKRIYVNFTVINQTYIAPSTCQLFIDSVKNPVSGNGKILNWNNTYRGDNWINGVNEKYTQYSASWSFNSQEGLADNYLIYKEVEVFDNKSINLSEVASWQKNDPACKLNSYWV